MWYPPNGIRYKLTETNWPTSEEAKESLLFKPIKIGNLILNSRTWVPAMVPWRATEDGFITENNLDWYGRFAAGKPGAIVVEATGIRDIPSGPLLRIGHDRFIPGLKKLVERVKQESNGETRLFIQIIDFLTVKRRPEPDKYFARFLEITQAHRNNLSKVLKDDHWLTANEKEVRQFLQNTNDLTQNSVMTERELESLRQGYRERVTDEHLPHIKNLPEVLPKMFSDAAKRAREAGFDGIELHYAHAYTMASFLSAQNTRKDGYGGEKENRVKLPLEVYRTVRKAVGTDYVVGLRFLGDEVIQGGNRLEDAVYFGLEFARAGFDFLSISKGGKFEDAKQPKIGSAVYPYTGPSGYECMPTMNSDEIGPFGRNINLAAKIKQTINEAGFLAPVVTAGGISTFELAEKTLQERKADIIGSARQSLADPDWFLKIKLGAGQEIRRCNYTNYCEALDQLHKEVTCKLWDQKKDELVKLTSDGRRRMVPPYWEKENNS
jgi:2,4-dienoyl-CoA reductase-like NADH-dependent reductase (Old Yellow Enzyme family)